MKKTIILICLALFSLQGFSQSIDESTRKKFSLVTLIWVFFRSQSLDEAIVVFKSIINNFGIVDGFYYSFEDMGFTIVFHFYGCFDL